MIRVTCSPHSTQKRTIRVSGYKYRDIRPAVVSFTSITASRMPPATTIAIIRNMKLENVPEIFQDFNVHYCELIVEDGQAEQWKAYVRCAPMRGLSHLSRSLAGYVDELHCRDRVPVNIVKLEERVLHFEVLAAIAYYWVAGRRRGKLSDSVKERNSIAFSFLDYLHNVRLGNQENYDLAFKTFFVPLVDHLSKRSDRRIYGFDTNMDEWNEDLMIIKHLRPDNLLDALEPAAKKPRLSGSDGRRYWRVDEASRKRSCKYINPDTLGTSSRQALIRRRDVSHSPSAYRSLSVSCSSSASHSSSALQSISSLGAVAGSSRVTAASGANESHAESSTSVHINQASTRRISCVDNSAEEHASILGNVKAWFGF